MGNVPELSGMTTRLPFHKPPPVPAHAWCQPWGLELGPDPRKTTHDGWKLSLRATLPWRMRENKSTLLVTQMGVWLSSEVRGKHKNYYGVNEYI